MEEFNPWWANELDYVYEEWKKSPIKWIPRITNEITLKPFSLHFLLGPRQVGKTTAIKILIHKLLENNNYNPKSIFYYSCDELIDHRELGEILDSYLSAKSSWNIGSVIIFLDEITFVKDWWRAIKSRVDLGKFANDVLILTGSASLELMRQKELFPGRRGKGQDFVMLPMDFSTYVSTFGKLDIKSSNLEDLDANLKANALYSNKISELFKQYLITGGFPVSIKDYYIYKRIPIEVNKVYLDWVRGDWSKAGRNEKYMKEILSYIIRARGTPISWNGIASETSINSPNTVRSYIETLEYIFSLNILYFLTPDFRIMYKKNKKIHFSDPFLFKVFSHYAKTEFSEDWLVEATVASHLKRNYPIYYWRNSSEVDVICSIDKRQIGFEVTWGIKKWQKPKHIKQAYLFDKTNIAQYLASLKYKI